ncbi:unnamed protein product [Allacma fusca]|uniref:RRM domain-containing protein n=1 Tax=Allacma fusca TaxID=39272 RepID=A0A8J2LTZ1_9HEXA|nr:unnamed protein product [Allacma fusca]
MANTKQIISTTWGRKLTIKDTTVKSKVKGVQKVGTKKMKNGKVPKALKLSHKDAAAIRVEAKRKFQDITAEKEVSVKQEDAPQKKKKILEKTSSVQKKTEEAEAAPPNDKKLKKMAKKLKQKEKKALLNGGTVTRNKNLKKNNKKAKLNIKLKQESSDEEDDEEGLSKIPGDLEDIIAKFEREQLDSEGEDSDEEDEKIVKTEESQPKKPKHFELNTPKDKKPEHESRTVFVGNLPTDVKEKVLKQLFNPFGDIETVRFRGAVPLKPYLLKKVAMYSHKLNPDQYNMSAYIRYKTKEQAEKAVTEMNGHTLDTHTLVVDIADNTKRDNKKALFVGNIPLKVEDDQLRKCFSECGKIDSVRIIRNATTGLSKGFGYVNFNQQDSIELALKKNGEDFEGRPLRVSRYIKKEKKPKDQIKQNSKGKTIPEGKFGPAGKKDFQSKKSGAARRIEFKNKKAANNASFTGDKLAEIGSLKRKANKPHKGELKKAKIAAQLTGVSTKQHYDPQYFLLLLKIMLKLEYLWDVSR